MALAIRQLHQHFVGEVSGLDLRKPLTLCLKRVGAPASHNS